MKRKIVNDSWKLSTTRDWDRVYEQRTPSGNYWDGGVATCLGYVEVYRQVSPYSSASFRFIWRGHEYHRQIEPAPTLRGTIRMASAFAREIAKDGAK